MRITQQGQSPPPLIFAPPNGKPKQLFVLLHGDGAAPEQLMALTQAFKQAFPDALLMLPYGAFCSTPASYYWLNPQTDTLSDANPDGNIVQAVAALAAQIRPLQALHGLSSEYTALAGFGQGATIALEACLAQSDLAGRVLAFSGLFARLPASAPQTTTLHFFHGADDTQITLAAMRQTHEHLAALHGDATLDIASHIGHELHEVLIAQAVHRLQTCIPLRSWQAALGELDIDVYDANDPDMGSDRTLH